jgi:hypothetical protein
MSMKFMRYIYLAMLISIIVVLITSLFGSSLSQIEDSNLASHILNNKTLPVPRSVKNFVILIPNEAHESPELPKDQRLINQPYVPQNLVIGANTKVIWFAGDVGHTRKVTLTDENSKKIYNSVLHFNSASKPLSFNQTGKYIYSESGANKQDPKFVMKGSITVVGSNRSDIYIKANSTIGNLDSMAVIMLPTRDIGKYVTTLVENNMAILDQYSFRDLRETGGGGGNQTLLVLGTNEPIDNVISVVKEITSTLPYS